MYISANMTRSEILSTIDFLYFAMTNSQTTQTKQQGLLAEDAIKLLIQARDKYVDAMNA